MEPLTNEPIQEDKTLEKLEKLPAFQYAPSFEDLAGGDLEKAEQAIQFCQGVTEATNLAIALAVRHIVLNELYKPEYSSFSEYFRDSETRLKMDRKKASWYLNSGIAYYSFRTKLDSAGFRPDGDFSKLQYLNSAIDRHGESEAIKNLAKMSVREYVEYARPKAQQIEFTKLDLQVEISKKGIAVEGKDVITIQDVKKIVDSGSEPFLIGLDSSGEKAAINRFLKEFRSKK